MSSAGKSFFSHKTILDYNNTYKEQNKKKKK